MRPQSKRVAPRVSSEHGGRGHYKEGEVVAVVADITEEGEQEHEDKQRVGRAAACAARVEVVGERRRRSSSPRSSRRQ
jgi:UDP-N-acetylmuramyl pentapeptide synthase